MPERSHQDRVKSLVLSRLRRSDIGLARRIRNLPSTLFSKISLNNNRLASPNASVLHAYLEAKQIADKYAQIIPLTAQDDTSLNDELKPLLVEANNLLSAQPSDVSSDKADTLSHFIGTKAHQGDLDTIQKLVNSLAHLSENSKIPQRVAQNYWRRAQYCLNRIDTVLSTFEKTLIAQSNIQIFQGEQSTIAQLSDPLYQKMSPALLRRALALPEKHPILFLDEKFIDGQIRVLSSEKIADRISLDSPEHALSWIKDKNGLFLQAHDHDNNIDQLLNQPSGPGVRTPIQSLSTILDKQTPSVSEDHLQLTQQDLEDFAQLQSLTGIAHANAQSQQVDATLTLHSAQRWFVKTATGKKEISLSELIEQPTQALFSGVDSKVAFWVPEHCLKRLKEKNTITVQLMQRNDNALTVSRLLDPETLTQGLILPHPEQKQQQQISQAYLSEQDVSRGYIDQQYQQNDLNVSCMKQGTDAAHFSAGLTEMLEDTEADLLIDVEVKSPPHQDSAPYFISMTLYSQTQQGPHVRRVSCLVHEPSNALPSQKQLDEFGLTEQSFVEKALSPDAAQKHLNKPLSRGDGAQIAFSLHNNNATLNDLQKVAPQIAEKIESSVTIDRQLLIKEEQFGLRRDRQYNVSLDRQQTNTVAFLDTPGHTFGIASAYQNKQGLIMGAEQKGLLSIAQDQIQLHDILHEVRGSVEGPEHFASSHHTQQRVAQNRAKGSPLLLAQHHRIQQLLLENAPTSPVQYIASILPNRSYNGLPSLTDELIVSLDKACQQHQTQYRFDLSIDDNIRLAVQLLKPQGVDGSTALAGGVGNKQGREFLLSLRSASPDLFSAITAGSGINLPALYQSSGETTVKKSQATLTVEDVFYANFARFQKANPAQVNHFQMSHIAAQVLNRLEPKTQITPKDDIEKLARYFCVSPDSLTHLYEMAYHARIEDSRSYHAFLPTAEDRHPLSPSSITDHVSLWGLRERAYLRPERKQQLHSHILNNKIKVFTHTLNNPNNAEGQSLLVGTLSDNKLEAQWHGAPLNPSAQKTLVDLISQNSRLTHLRNGVHHVSSKNVSTSPEQEAEAKHKLLHLLTSPQAQQMEKELSDFIGAHDGELKILPNDAKMRQWESEMLRYAIGETKSPVFNQHFNEATLDYLEQSSHLFVQNPDNQRYFTNPSLVETRLAQGFRGARTQFIGYALAEQCVKALEHAPLLDVAQNPHKETFEITQHPFTLVSTFDLIEQMLNSNKGKQLPDSTQLLLARAIEQDERPKKQDDLLAHQLYNKVTELLQKPPTLGYVAPELDGLKSSFKTAARSPMESLLDDPRYAHCLFEDTPLTYSLSQTNKPTNC